VSKFGDPTKLSKKLSQGPDAPIKQPNVRRMTARNLEKDLEADGQVMQKRIAYNAQLRMSHKAGSHQMP